MCDENTTGHVWGPLVVLFKTRGARTVGKCYSFSPTPTMSTPSAPVLFSFPTKDGLRDALSSFVAKTSADAIAKHGSFAIAISGGNVPKLLGGLIKEPTVQWDKW